MNCTPLVTVIIPTYNYGQFICQAVDSILNSEFPQSEIEIIIVDDGSTDDTSEKIKTYGDRVKYIFQENLGKAWATRVAIEHSQGKYLFNLDADDFFLTNKIQEVVNVFAQDSNIVHVAHPAIHWNISDDIKTVEAIPRSLIGQKTSGRQLLSYFYNRKIIFGGGSTFAGRTEVLKNLCIPKEVDMFIDEYLILFTLNQGNSYFIEEPLSVWRVHKKNYSGGAADHSLINTKMQRSIKSQEAVLDSLQNSNLEEEIKILYQLKVKVATLATKEQRGQKSFSDIYEIWLYVLKNLSKFNQDIFLIIKSYTLLNRSLPSGIIKLIKTMKSTT
ncbi:MAG: glycosyltransferase family 2 protein [Coleofasciculaceae cyanobacterium]